MFALEGLVIGFLGGLHCIGMCGPLALAIPLKGTNPLLKVINSLAYNLGRAGTYAGIGAIFGLLGTGLRMTGIQQWVSIACGVIMILSVVLSRLINVNAILSKYNPFRIIGVQHKIAVLLSKPNSFTTFFIGILNGFLPCGLVYVALAGALVSNSMAQSSLFMFAFGLGTLPYLFALILFGNTLKTRFTKAFNTILPIFIVVLGILFILRGANLGIKYVSPKFSEHTEEAQTPSCH